MSARIVVCLLLSKDDRSCIGYGFNYAVETYQGNHPKQCIRDTEKEVGFYRHDQWGLLALLTRVVRGIFNGGGDLGFRLHFDSTNNTNIEAIIRQCTNT